MVQIMERENSTDDRCFEVLLLRKETVVAEKFEKKVANRKRRASSSVADGLTLWYLP